MNFNKLVSFILETPENISNYDKDDEQQTLYKANEEYIECDPFVFNGKEYTIKLEKSDDSDDCSFFIIYNNICVAELQCEIRDGVLTIKFPLQDQKYKGLLRGFYIDYLLSGGVKRIVSDFVQTPLAFDMWKKMAENDKTRIYILDMNNKLKEIQPIDMENIMVKVR